MNQSINQSLEEVDLLLFAVYATISTVTISELEVSSQCDRSRVTERLLGLVVS